MTALTVKANVNSGIDRGVTQRGIVFHTNDCRFAIQVVGAGSELLFRIDGRAGRGSILKHQPEASLVRYGDGDAIASEEENTFLAARQVANLRSALPTVDFKC